MKLRVHMKLALLLLIVCVAAVTLLAQTGRQLYVITGYASNNVLPIDVASDLIAIDDDASRAVPVAELAKGSSFITADHDRKLVIIGTYPLVVVDMNTAKPHTIP